MAILAPLDSSRQEGGGKEGLPELCPDGEATGGPASRTQEGRQLRSLQPFRKRSSDIRPRSLNGATCDNNKLKQHPAK